MSGRKRGRISFAYVDYYDPTPVRIADLRNFAAKLERWLARHYEFLERNLGKESADRARAAYKAVLEFIDLGSPDEGFDAYGRAWEICNGLWRKAAEKREERRQALAERRMRQAQEKERADALIAGCSDAWSDREIRRLLRRWAPEGEMETLAHEIGSLSQGRPEEIINKATAWLEKFRQTLLGARNKAEANAERAAELLTQVSTTLSTLHDLDVSALEAAERASAQHEISKLRARADAALTDENIAQLQELPGAIQALRADLSEKIEVNRINRATEAWKAALEELGYTVQVRSEEESGTTVIQASSFPMSSLVATFQPGSDEIALRVNGEHDTTQCIHDIDSIQKALAKRGMELEMTDWGRAEPSAQLLQSQSLHQALRRG